MKTFNKWQRLVIAALAGSIAMGASVQAFAHGQGRHHGGSQAAMDPAKMDQRIESMVQRMLGRVNATEEQRTKVTAIAKQAAADLRTLRGTRGELRTRAMALLAAPTVDRAAIEALRAEQIKLADAASKRMTQALADTAEVLTPEQRAKLAERMKERRGHRHHS